MLRKGGSALDAVEACARVIEADPSDTSVGRGGKPNVLGVVELDASLVDGTTHRVGAVGALAGYLHPISVARAVMERLPHVMLVGDGAARFAAEIRAEKATLLTASTRKMWVERLAKARETPASVRRRTKLAPVVAKTVGEERGTVNFIALDRKGDIASAVSTSGWAYKYPGRLGDSPIVGAGNYCDTRYGGACCTGFGELAIRNVTAKTAVDRLATRHVRGGGREARDRGRERARGRRVQHRGARRGRLARGRDQSRGPPLRLAAHRHGCAGDAGAGDRAAARARSTRLSRTSSS